MELRHFRYFVAVAEELSFTKAARRLHISQPPLSQHVQEIERELGALLFRRTRGQVALTEAGSLFLDEARAVLGQAAHAIDTAKRAGRGELGLLRIAFTATAPFVSMFSDAIHAYRREFPNVHLSLQASTTEPIVAALRMGELDVGMVRPPASALLPPDIAAIPVMRDRLMLALHADHPLAQSQRPVPFEALADEPFVLRASGRNAGFYEQVYQCCTEAGFLPHIAQEANEAATILGLVAAGLGVSVLPAALRAIAVKGVVWRALVTKSSAESAVYLVFNANQGDTVQRAAFIRLVQHYAELDDDHAVPRTHACPAAVVR